MSLLRLINRGLKFVLRSTSGASTPEALPLCGSALGSAGVRSVLVRSIPNEINRTFLHPLDVSPLRTFSASPHRNRYTVFLNSNTHMAFHFRQTIFDEAS